MSDERIERLLRGYRLPEVSHTLDEEVLREGAAILGRAHVRTQAAAIGLTVLILHQLWQQEELIHCLL